MSYPYADPARFEGLIDHVERHLGPVDFAVPASVEGHNRGFAVGVHKHPTIDMVTAASTGVRFQRYDASLPEEFACSALPGQEQEAAYLVHVVADRVVRSGKGYEFGRGYVNAEPLIPGSHVQCLLAVPHPWADEDFSHFRNAQGEAVLQIITLLPLTRPELDSMDPRSDPVEQILSLTEAKGLDVRDIYRDSAV